MFGLVLQGMLVKSEECTSGDDRHHPRARRPARRRRARDPAARQRPDLGRPAGRQEPRAREEAGRHDRPALLLRLGEERHRQPADADRGPVHGGQERVPAPPEIDDNNTTGASTTSSSRTSSSRRARTRRARTCCRSSTAGCRKGYEILTVPPGTVVAARREAGRTSPPTRRSTATSSCATTRSCEGTDLKDPRAGVRPDRRASRSSRSSSRTRGARTSRRSPSRLAERGQTEADPGPAGRELVPDLRDRARPRGGLAPVHRLPREPERDRRPHGRADLGRLHAPGGAGPRERAEDRRAADHAEADQRDAGLRDAR